MTRRRLLLANFGSVTVGALAGFLVLCKFVFDRHGLWISDFLAVFVAVRAGGDWYVGRQSAQSAGARNVDVARCAFIYVCALAALMRELCRDTFWSQYCDERRRRLVAAAAVFAGRFQILPMTVKACIVTMRHRLEWIEHRRIGRRGRKRRDRERLIRLMTDRAVVVIGFLVVKRSGEGRDDESNVRPSGRDRVLMLVVRKLDGELPLWFGSCRLTCVVWLAESESPVFSGGCAYVTNSADCRTGADHCLAREELRSMASHACVVIGKIRDIGKFALRIPGSWNLMTSIALKALVLIR